jgi:hypothetical protein
MKYNLLKLASGNNCNFLVLKSNPVIRAVFSFKTIGKSTLVSKMEIEVLSLLF